MSPFLIRCAALTAVAIVGVPAVSARVVCGIDLSEFPGTVGGYTSGTNINRSTDLNITGPFFMEGEVTLRFQPGAGIVVRDGGVLVACGFNTEFSPVLLRGNTSPTWEGVRVEAGGLAYFFDTSMRSARVPFVTVTGEGARAVVDDSFFIDGPGRYFQVENGGELEVYDSDILGTGTSFGNRPSDPASYLVHSMVRATSGSSIWFEGNDVSGFRGKEGEDGRNATASGGAGRSGDSGGSLAVFDLDGAQTAVVFNNDFGGNRGGSGGNGGFGFNGVRGDDGENPLFGGAEPGEPGGTGGGGGAGGSGANGFLVTAFSVQELIVAQNNIYEMRGGSGGSGGGGANGGVGGNGADGGNGPFPGDGANGGRGGHGGRGGNGGFAGDGGVALIGTPGGQHAFVNNTIRRLGGGGGGGGGSGGGGVRGGFGGDGGDGPFGSMGDDGSDGGSGSDGADGTTQAAGDAIAFGFSSPISGGVPVLINNNIVTYSSFSTSDRVGILASFSGNNASIDVRKNIIFGATLLAEPSNLSGEEEILTVDPLVTNLVDNPAVLAGSPAIDAGINAAVPRFITAAYPTSGFLRYLDTGSVPNTGDNGGVAGMGVVDIGASEFAGAICGPADFNGDGRLDAFDVGDGLQNATDIFDVLDVLDVIGSGCN